MGSDGQALLLSHGFIAGKRCLSDLGRAPKSLKPLRIQASAPSTAPKSDTLVHLTRLIGSESLITRENEEWEALRERFNPGVQPKHIYSLTPSVVTKTQMFVT